MKFLTSKEKGVSSHKRECYQKRLGTLSFASTTTSERSSGAVLPKNSNYHQLVFQTVLRIEAEEDK